MQPQSLQHTISEAEKQTVAAAAAGYLCYASNRSDGRSDGGGLLLQSGGEGLSRCELGE